MQSRKEYQAVVQLLKKRFLDRIKNEKEQHSYCDKHDICQSTVDKDKIDEIRENAFKFESLAKEHLDNATRNTPQLLNCPNQVKLTKLYCHQTEDVLRDDARLVVSIDNTVVWVSDTKMDNGDTWNLNLPFTFHQVIKIGLIELDFGFWDSHDDLGTVYIHPHSLDGFAKFTKSGAHYEIFWEKGKDRTHCEEVNAKLQNDYSKDVSVATLKLQQAKENTKTELNRASIYEQQLNLDANVEKSEGESFDFLHNFNKVCEEANEQKVQAILNEQQYLYL